MLPTALNHMTAAQSSLADLLSLASDQGCVGIELRTDLPRALFDGIDPESAGRLVKQRGLRILALAEIKGFNEWSDDKRDEVIALIDIAVACGAEAISLIPRNDGLGLGNGERQANLRLAMREIKPMLKERALLGFIEPLGFESCSLRQKSEAINAIEAVGGEDCFKIVHDTFHHSLAGSGAIFPKQTGIVHISGVIDAKLALGEMTDSDRMLVDARDRLGNVAQIQSLIAAGFVGPISFEAFAPEVHSSKTLSDDIAQSFEFIQSRLLEKVS